MTSFILETGLPKCQSVGRSTDVRRANGLSVVEISRVIRKLPIQRAGD